MVQPRVLFFIDGPVPSVTDKQQANTLRGQGAIVSFRNVRYVGEVGAGVEEKAHGVAGAVPDVYAGHTTAEDAIKAYQDGLVAESAGMVALGDVLATGGAAGVSAEEVAKATAAAEAAKLAGGGFQPSQSPFKPAQ